MKKILHQMVAFVGVLILSLGLCVSPIQVYAIEDYYDVNNVPTIISLDDISKYQSNGEKAFNVLNKILDDDVVSGETQYNDFVDKYAGSIIDKNGNLIIYIAGDVNEMSKLNDAFSNEFNIQMRKEKRSNEDITVLLSDVVTYEQVKFSYNELKEQQKEIWELRNSLLNNVTNKTMSEWANKIVSAAITPQNNCVTIFVNNFESSDYELCYNLFENFSCNIVSIEGDCKITECVTTLKPGQSISTGGSLGFRCELNGVKGFTTAVHTKNYSSITVKDGNTQIGKVTAGVYDGKADFCFVEVTNNNYSVSQTTNTSPSYTLSNTSYIVSLPIGYTVYFAGCNSYSARTGKVIYFDYSIANGNEWLLCDLNVNGGDSGGCIFAYMYGEYKVLGVVDGLVNYDTTTIYAYGTKYTTMKQYYSGLDLY